MAITNWPEEERPREKLLLRGAKQLTDAELLAIFLRTGSPGKTAIDIARELLGEFGGLKKLLNTAPDRLYLKQGFGKAKYAMLKAAIELGQRYLEDTLQKGETLNGSQAAKRFLTQRLRDYPHEVFACLFLDTHHRVLCFEELCHGTINEANVYPREVVKRALSHNAAKIILAHNHPSGNTTPSQADCDLTEALKHALALVDIQVIDHIIVGTHDCFSLMEEGYMT
ncbi:MAG: DNA repair protein RadC [Gammaproteobacteria bacterium]|nr:DNA repair protein RadC [Gammaproteobacteria bacterium]